MLESGGVRRAASPREETLAVADDHRGALPPSRVQDGRHADAARDHVLRHTDRMLCPEMHSTTSPGRLTMHAMRLKMRATSPRQSVRKTLPPQTPLRSSPSRTSAAPASSNPVDNRPIYASLALT